jgi:hypothetical protein
VLSIAGTANAVLRTLWESLSFTTGRWYVTSVRNVVHVPGRACRLFALRWCSGGAEGLPDEGVFGRR